MYEQYQLPGNCGPATAEEILQRLPRTESLAFLLTVLGHFGFLIEQKMGEQDEYSINQLDAMVKEAGLLRHSPFTLRVKVNNRVAKAAFRNRKGNYEIHEATYKDGRIFLTLLCDRKYLCDLAIAEVFSLLPWWKRLFSRCVPY